MENIMLQFAEVLQNKQDKAYDFIAINSYKFSKDELTYIIKELLFSIHMESKYGQIIEADHDKILSNVGKEIIENYTN